MSGVGQGQLQQEYRLWFSQRSEVLGAYDARLVAGFGTVHAFWALYAHLQRPSVLPPVSTFHVFKHDIKPFWEDHNNANGGKWVLKVRKGVADRLWENMLLAIVGGDFDFDDEFCGVILSVRASEDIISVWNRNANNEESKAKLKQIIQTRLELPKSAVIEYKTHDSSKQYRKPYSAKMAQ